MILEEYAKNILMKGTVCNMPAYKDGNGKWRTTFYCGNDNEGKRKKINKRGFDTKKSALEYERDFIAKNKGSVDMSFISLTELYFNYITNQKKGSTIFNETQTIKRKIIPFFKKYKIREITPLVVDNWQKSLNGKISSKKLINSYLKNVFTFAYKFTELNFNPVIENIKGEDNIVKKEVITVDILNQILKQTKEEKYKMLYKVLFWTGMRIGEALALTFDDVNLNAKKITINKTLSKDKNGKPIKTSPKTRTSNRIITIDDNLRDDLQIYFSRFFLKEGEIFNFTSASVIANLKKIDVGIKLKPHLFRHSHSTFLISKGVNPVLVAERLGHKDIATTLSVYSHTTKEMEDVLNKILNK